jgi:hypothetical protein
MKKNGFFFFTLHFVKLSLQAQLAMPMPGSATEKTPIPKHPNLIKHFANVVPSSLCKSKT